MSLFTGTVPLEVDVTPLIEKYKQAEIGFVVTHQEIVNTTSVAYGTHRYMTVVNVFKARMLREYNMDLGSVHGVGYRVLDSLGRMSKYFSMGEKAMRGISRSYEGLVRTPREGLTVDEVVRLDSAESTLGELNKTVIYAKATLVTPSKKVALPSPKVLTTSVTGV